MKEEKGERGRTRRKAHRPTEHSSQRKNSARLFRCMNGMEAMFTWKGGRGFRALFNIKLELVAWFRAFALGSGHGLNFIEPVAGKE